jgi:hypothetical protein
LIQIPTLYQEVFPPVLQIHKILVDPYLWLMDPEGKLTSFYKDKKS